MTKPFPVEKLRCLELARIIREGLEGVRFDMSGFTNECGTAGCIASYAIAFYRPEIWKNRDNFNRVFEVAATLLGLPQHEADTLFIYSPGCYSDITPAMAATTLENYAMTGKVEWPQP